MTEAPRLAMTGITRVFDGVTVVDGVSLEVRAGEIVCLLGPSGCGKSTTLRIAAGVDQQTSGVVSLNGRDVSDDRRHAPPEDRSVGLMFQDFALFPHLTVAENVAFGLRARKDRAEMAAEYLEKVDLGGFGDKYPHQLSGGEQQRVHLARALAQIWGSDRGWLLLDEPDSALDIQHQQLLKTVIEEVTAKGISVVLVSHDLNLALACADKILGLGEGKKAFFGEPETVISESSLSDLFSTAVTLTNHPSSQRPLVVLS